MHETMMGDTKTKENKKKGFITAEDTAALIQRYSATTILTLLKEVAHLPPTTAKIDYDHELIAKTATGITNPREYQMLWRHLAYREPLLDKLDDGARPVDVDSDLEYEVEAAPPDDASTDEIAACVNILMNSGFPTVKAPSTINIPVATGKTGKKAIMAAAKAEDDGGNTPANNSMAPRKTRIKRWSKEEDSELISAVGIYGEENWAEIVKANFMGVRTASQLSVRYGTLKKRLKLGLGEGGTPSDQKEKLLRANQAMTHALDNTNANSECGVTNRIRNSWMQTTTSAENLDARKPNRMMGSLCPTRKRRVTSKKTLAKFNKDADSLAATAVAAGARIVSQSDAELLKAAPQGKKTVNIRTGSATKLPSSSSICP